MILPIQRSSQIPASTPQPGTAAGRPPTTTGALVRPGESDAPTRVSDTPRRLQLLTLALVTAGILFGLVGCLVFVRLAYGMDRAEQNTAQLVRVQQIQSNLLTADATATNAFLVGGLEPDAQRLRYDRAIQATSTLVAQAADAQPADADALAALNRSVLAYAATIEQARANNRQGLPVGAQYLRGASAQLRGEALPVLDNLNVANTGRAADEMDLGAGWLLIPLGLVVLTSLIATMVWLARRFRRRINVGVLVAALVVAAALLGSVVGMIQLSQRLSDLRQSSFSSLTAAANARIQANNAKSNESLTLIARGSGASFEKAWAESSARVQRSVSEVRDSDLDRLWSGYSTVHKQIRALDDGGAWEKAVATATGTGAGSSNATFGAFDSAAAAELESAGGTVASELAAAQPGLVTAAVLTLIAGLAAAVLARRGLAERLREYR